MTACEYCGKQSDNSMHCAAHAPSQSKLFVTQTNDKYAFEPRLARGIKKMKDIIELNYIDTADAEYKYERLEKEYLEEEIDLILEKISLENSDDEIEEIT